MSIATAVHVVAQISKARTTHPAGLNSLRPKSACRIGQSYEGPGQYASTRQTKT